MGAFLFFVGGDVAAVIESLREERGELNKRYGALTAKYTDKEGKLKPVREWDPADKADMEDIHGRLRDVSDMLEVEDLLARADEDDERATRAALSGASFSPGKTDMNPEEQKRMEAFNKMLRGIGLGNQELIREARQQSADILGEGGFTLAPQMFVNGVLRNVDNNLVIPTLATVYNDVPATGLGMIRETVEIDEPSWGTETSAAPESDVEVGNRNMIPVEHKLLVKITEKLIENSRIDFVAYVLERIAYKYGVAAEKAMMNGTGINQPLGIFTASNDGISTSRDVETAGSGVIAADDIIDLVSSLKEGHVRSATMVLHRLVLKAVRKLKGSDGHYIWQPDGNVGKGIVGGNPATINGVSYVLSEYAPSAVSAGNYAIVIGNFKHYVIARGSNLRIKTLNERYADEFKIGYRCLASMDAQPVLDEAFSRMKVKA